MKGPDGEESAARAGSLVSRAHPTDADPATALRAFAAPRVSWAAPRGIELAGCGVAARVRANGPDRFAAVRAGAADLFRERDAGGPPEARPRLLGGFAFHDAHAAGSPWRGFPGAWFLLPRVQVARVEGQTWVTVTERGPDVDPAAVEAAAQEAVATLEATRTTAGPPPGVAHAERVPGRAAWRAGVEEALSRIAAGDLRKVVLAQSLRADLRDSFDLADALARLAGRYDDCYRFGVDPGRGASFVGAPPERLVRRRGAAVRTEALAGSIDRGDSPGADDRLAGDLRDSSKVQREHRLVADAVEERLEPFAASVRTADREVARFANVQHLRTPIEADLREETHVLSLVEALHPTPAVGGDPTEAARRFIRETEAFDRGWYAAPVGWFDAEGDGEFAVAIRSAVVDGDRATLFAGNGIVEDSDPDAEYDELQLKYRPVLDHLR